MKIPITKIVIFVTPKEAGSLIPDNIEAVIEACRAVDLHDTLKADVEFALPMGTADSVNVTVQAD